VTLKVPMVKVVGPSLLKSKCIVSIDAHRGGGGGEGEGKYRTPVRQISKCNKT
jgi:hypothetical protein